MTHFGEEVTHYKRMVNLKDFPSKPLNTALFCIVWIGIITTPVESPSGDFQTEA